MLKNLQLGTKLSGSEMKDIQGGGHTFPYLWLVCYDANGYPILDTCDYTTYPACAASCPSGVCGGVPECPMYPEG